MGTAALRFHGRIAALVGLVCWICLIQAAGASATVRYAAPGGTAADTVCVTPQAAPCSINTAAAGPDVTNGDEAVIAPGSYSDAAGDLGGTGTVEIVAGVNVHGASGQPRPVITLNNTSIGFGAFTVGTAARLAHVEIDTAAARSNYTVFDGVAEDVVAQSSSTAANTIVCLQFDGIIRDSACLSSGAGAASVGISNQGGGPFTPILRNVTAVSTGSGGFGLSFSYFISTVGTVDAKSVIAEGAGTDVQARAVNSGASSTVNLDHSAYDTTNASGTGGGTASVTAAGTNNNITGAPLLASDGIHELAGSATIDMGVTDSSSGSADIDAQARTIGSATDIGADELGHATTAALSCAPTSVVLGSASTCTATVTDTGSGPTAPTGRVAFSSAAAGVFSGGGSCTLAALNGSQSRCQVAYTPSQIGGGSHAVTGAYSGDSTHDASQGGALVAVAAAATDNKPPNATLGKKPKKRTTKRRAKFTFSSSEAGSHFKCKLDRKPYTPCSSPFVKRVKPGKHRFRVEAIDAAGNVDPTPASYRWKVLMD
jgi:hypothetical protein